MAQLKAERSRCPSSSTTPALRNCPADDQLVEVVRRFDPEGVDVEVIAVVTEQLRAARLRRQADQREEDLIRHLEAEPQRGCDHRFAIDHLGIEQEAVHVEHDGFGDSWNAHGEAVNARTALRKITICVIQ